MRERRQRGGEREGARDEPERGPVRRLRARATALLTGLGLRDRVTLATAAVLAGGLALLSAGALLVLDIQLDRDLSSTLNERADAQQAAIAQVDGRTVVRRTPDDVLDERAWIFDADGRALRRPRSAPEVERAARALAGVPRATEHDVGDEVRLRAEPVHASAGDAGSGAAGTRIGTVVVGVSQQPYERTEHLALLGIALLDLCIVVFGALLARRAVGKALQPVADMTAQAAEWSEHDLDRRFDLGPPRDELTALSATLDGLLARIASSVRREQRFSAEMAHELRTPLSGVRGEAELALRASDRLPDDVRAALEQIVRGTDRMQSVIDALLTAARGKDGSGGVSDAAAAARTAIEAAAAAAERAGVRLTLSGGSAAPGAATAQAAGTMAGVTAAVALPPAGVLRVGAEERLVVQALAPLLENAIRHAHAGVILRVERVRGDVLLHVEDDGEGFAEEERASVFAPGVSSSGGAGLGLPLARRLARSAGGEISIGEPPADGAGGRVVLRLPAVG